MNKVDKAYIEYWVLLEKALIHGLPSEWAFLLIEKKYGGNIAEVSKVKYLKFLNNNNGEERKNLEERISKLNSNRENKDYIQSTNKRIEQLNRKFKNLYENPNNLQNDENKNLNKDQVSNKKKRTNKTLLAKETRILIDKAYRDNQKSQKASKRDQKKIDFKIRQGKHSDKRYPSDPRDFKGASRSS